MNWLRKLFSGEAKRRDQKEIETPPTRTIKPAATAAIETLATPARVKAPAANTPASMSEARAMADKLGLLKPGAVAAAWHLGQKPSGTIDVSGVITCVCAKALPLTVSMAPGWSGGGPSVSCPDCGTRIAIMEEISGDTAVIVASIEAVKREYLTSTISLVITGFPEKEKVDGAKPAKLNEKATIEICDWCSASDLSKHDALSRAFMTSQFGSPQPDWRGLEQMASRLPEGWMRHVLWLNLGCTCKSERRWQEAARCYTLSLGEYYQYKGWSDGLSAAWGVVELAEMSESWAVISKSLAPDKAVALGEELRTRSNKVNVGAELNRSIVSMLRESFPDWPNQRS